MWIISFKSTKEEKKSVCRLTELRRPYDMVNKKVESHILRMCDVGGKFVKNIKSLYVCS